MGRYRKIDVKMYGDEKFCALTAAPPNAQTLWVYLLTGPHTTNLPGLCVSGEAAMSEALGWPLEAFREAFREASLKGMVRADWKARVLWLPNAVKYNRPESPNVIIGWRKSWDEIPECELKQIALSSIRDEVCRMSRKFVEAFRKAFPEAFHKAFREGSPNQEQEQEQEQELNTPPHAGARVEEVPDETEAIRTSALEAFDQWSHVSRRHGIDELRNEHTKIFQLIDRISANPPIPLANGVVGQQAMIPRAVECLKLKNKPFRDVSWACGCVEKELADWSREGMPGSNGKSIRAGPMQQRGQAAFEQACAMIDAEGKSK